MNFCKRNKKRRQRALGLGLGLGLWGSNSKLRLLYGAMRENLDQLSQRLPLAYTALHRTSSSSTCPPLYRRQTAGSTVREIIAVSKDSEIVANPPTTDYRQPAQRCGKSERSLLCYYCTKSQGDCGLVGVCKHHQYHQHYD